jgi:hypothetical protein
MNKRITIRDIAGFCPEEAVWKMMVDVCEFMLKEGIDCVLTPDSIAIDGCTFMVETEHESIKEFLAPEQNDVQKAGITQMVWSLGAIAYYVATGHIVFGGHGGSYQKDHPLVSLPILPKGLKALTPVIQQCLCYAPDERINLKELKNLTQEGLAACEKRHRKKSVKIIKEHNVEVIQIGERWPEEMIAV